MTRATPALLALLLALPTACSKPVVMRSAGGQLYEGRFIHPRAYEAYARGALAEAEGRLEEAQRMFGYAADLDEDGPEPATRLGAVLCKRGQRDEAMAAFATATEVDATYAAAYRERARCDLSHGEIEAAVEASELAAILDPDDEDAALLHVDALEKARKLDAAARLLVARLMTAHPSRALIARLEALAQAAGDDALLHLAARARDRAQLRGAAATAQAPDPAPPRSRLDIDAALRRGDLTAARSLATRAKTSQGEIALRAAALGRTELAREQGTLVSEADPRDASALVALIVAADASRSLTALAAASDAARALASGGASPLARLLLAETLARRIGAEAARALVSDAELAQQRSDPLEDAVRLRVRAALGAR